MARKLAPPAEPETRRSLFLWWVIMPIVSIPCIFFPLLTFFWAPIARKTKMIMLGLALTAFILIIGQSGSAFLGIVALSCIAAWLILYYTALFKEKEDREDQKRQKEAHELSEWQRAMEVWNRLYYCQRHDCVFDPLTGKSAPVHAMGDLLYQ